MGQFAIMVGQLVGFFIMLMVGYGCVRLRFYGQTGSFEKGYAFDALVIHMDDIEGLERTPFEKLQQFIYDGDDRNIIARYVDGVSR
jgi:cytosine/adenosine deaminase-related metal-dependent hydrolase